MSVNSLIAQGGRYVDSPVQRYLQTKGQMEQGRLRQAQEQGAYQTMGIRGQQQDQAMRQERTMMVAQLAKAVLSSPETERQVVYDQAKQQLTEMGIDMSQAPQVPDEANLRTVMAAGGLELDEQWEQGTSPSGAPMQQSTTTRLQKPGITAKGPGVQTNVYTGSNPFMKKQAENFFKEKEKLPTAVKSLKNLEVMESLMDEGMITGSMANAQLSVGNFLKKVGLWDDDKGLVENTQSYFATTAKETANIIQEFGAGTGLSDADREYAMRAAGGDIAMTEESLRNIIKINRIATIGSLSGWNQEVDLQPDELLPNKNAFKVDIPPEYSKLMSDYDAKWGYSGRKKKGGEPEQKNQLIEVDW